MIRLSPVLNLVARVPRRLLARTLPVSTRPKTASVEPFQMRPPIPSAQEDFFPEYLLTLPPTSFFEFFEKHHDRFSPASWGFALRRCLQILKLCENVEETANTLSFLEPILLQTGARFAEIAPEDQLEILNALALQDFSFPPIVAAVVAADLHWEAPNHYVCLYLMRHLSPDSPKFRELKGVFEKQFFGETEVTFKTHPQLVLALEIYLTKTEDLDGTAKIESSVLQGLKHFNTKSLLRILSAYRNCAFKTANMDIVDLALDSLGKNIGSLTLPQISEAVQAMDHLDTRSVQFMAGAANHLLDLFRDRTDLSESEAEALSVAFYTFARHDVG